MADTTYALTQVVAHGTGTKAQAVKRPVAGKTGSSNDNKAAWFAGYTTDVAVVFGLSQDLKEGNGEDTITPMGKYSEVTGSTVPADMWTSFMKKLYTSADSNYSKLPKGDFPKPAFIGGTLEPTVEASEEEAPEVPEAPASSEAPPPVDSKVNVPGVVGMSQSEAESALKSAGVRYVVSPRPSAKEAGTVLSTNPGAGTKIDPSLVVSIVVSSGPSTSPTQPPVDPEGGG